MGFRGGRLLASLFICVTGAAPVWGQQPPASSQEKLAIQPEPGEHDTVLTRQRPEYDPIGIRLGSFFLYPKGELTEVFRDNIFFASRNKESDFISVISPGLFLKSNWNAHALNLFTDLDLGRHASNSDEDYLDLRTGLDGRIDIDRSTKFGGGLKFAKLHEDRASPDQTGTAEPVIYNQYGMNAALTKRFNRTEVRAIGDMTFFDFDDAPANNGSIINMDDRDRREIKGTGRIGYDIMPNYEAFVRGTVNQRNYLKSVDDSNVDRDSHGWETVVGMALKLSGVTFGNVFAGYMRQTPDDPSLKTVDGPSFGGDVTWNPTRLTTVKLAANRTIEDTTLSGASGALATDARLTVDHELLRNVLLSASANYTNWDYRGIGRSDDVVGLGLGATYLLNRYARVSLKYAHDRRDSDAVDGDYSVNTVFLRLSTQY